MNRDTKFIFTSNKDSANQLEQLGFNLIVFKPDDYTWLFENNSKIYFENINDVVFTNKINFTM